MESLPILKYIKKYPVSFALQAFGGILYNTLVAYGVVLLGKIIDAAISKDFGMIVKAVVIYLAVVFAFQFGRYIKRYFVADFGLLMEMDLKKDIFNAIVGKSINDLERDKVGDLMSRSTSDVTKVTGAISKTVEEIWDTWLLLVSYFVSLLLMNWKITLLSSVFIPVSILAAQFIRHPLYKYSKQYAVIAAKISINLQQTIIGIPILRLFGAEEQRKKELNNDYERQMKASLMTSIFQSAMVPIYVAVASTGVIVIIILGGKEVLAGNWKIGTLWSFLTIFTAMAARTPIAAKVFNMWHAAVAAWERIAEEMNHFDAINKKSADKISNVDVVAKNLSFQYPIGTSDVLDNISFDVDTGSVVGITGPVGCGKTALCLSFTGVYDYKGSILVNGTELRELDEEKRAGMISYLGHEQFLFSSSIKDNITINPGEVILEVDEDRLQKAIYFACLEDDLKKMENGINTIVGERGVKVSGGQKQRIALARAIYADRPLLLLDDPFSALDILTEQKIVDRLKQMKDKTILIFSHRLEVFKSADHILVIQNGKISEQGTHKELIRRSGVYERIYNAQNC